MMDKRQFKSWWKRIRSDEIKKKSVTAPATSSHEQTVCGPHKKKNEITQRKKNGIQGSSEVSEVGKKEIAMAGRLER